jgi:hypothetical protein
MATAAMNPVMAPELTLVPKPSVRTLVEPARYVFIMSPERSGSTLLSAMLGGHSRVITSAELHLLRYPTLGEWRRAYPAAETSLTTLLEAANVDPGPLHDDLAPAALYHRIRRRAPAGSFLVDKTPAYARSAEALETAESFAPLYIWLVRHPLAVAASRLKRMWAVRRGHNDKLVARLKYPAHWARQTVRTWTGSSPRALAEDWADVHQRLRRFLGTVGPDRVIRVHYEDLVRAPFLQLQGLCDFLGLEPEPAMLDPRSNAPRGLRWGLGDESILEHAGITTGPADAWRKELSEDLLSPRVHRLARSLGVRLDPGTPARPLSRVPEPLSEGVLLQTS